jgi:4-hydroxy-tetrahydrodipicolinate synthase
MNHTNFRGSIVPIVTPFKKGELDLNGFSELIEWQIANGAHGISVTGTTGEPSALTLEERKLLIKTAVDVIAKRVPFVPGTGSANHEETMKLSRYAEKVGADALLLISPYYSRPSQEGIFKHFDTVAKIIDLPIILYNIPGRTAVNIEIDTVAQLKEHNENIIGVKESNKDFEHINRLLNKMGREFNVYSGIELLCYPILAIGGAGYVSATANLLPKQVNGLYDLAVAGKWEEAQQLHFDLMELNDAVFLEINPVPVKTALGLMGKINPEVRLPLSSLSLKNYDQLVAVLRKYKLIPQLQLEKVIE